MDTHQQQHQHVLSFRVMRLRRPQLHAEKGPALPRGFFVDNDSLDDVAAAAGERARQRERADEAAGVNRASCLSSGALAIPSSFGNIYLGENFRAYVSVVNHATSAAAVSPRSLSSSMGVLSGASGEVAEAHSVCVKAELHSERNRTLLHDSAATPTARLLPGESLGFVVDQDIKEPGTHTLVCSVTYSDAAGERRYMPQYFKFNVVNPLAVRTKVRGCGATTTFIEVCVENVSKEPMLLEGVAFDVAQGYTKQDIVVPRASAAAASASAPVAPSSSFASTPCPPALSASLPSASAADAHAASCRQRAPVPPNELLNASVGPHGGAILLCVGGARQYLFRLDRNEGVHGRAVAALGRVELRWRRNMGERGRLQTQQISSGSAHQRRDVDVTMVAPFPEPTLDSPFTVHLAVKCDLSNGDAVNATNANSLAIAITGNEESENRCMLHGQQSIAIGEMSPDAEKLVRIQLIALVPGVLRITGLVVVDTAARAAGAGGGVGGIGGGVGGAVVSKVPPIELFVKSPPSRL